MNKIPNKKSPKTIVSVVMPVFNEERTISTIIDQVHASGIKNIELIVVDDNSTDQTRSILKKNKNKISKLILRQKNGGKGAALRDGFAAVTGDIVLIQDADLEYTPQDYQRLIQPILDDRADVVFGSRFVGSHPHRIVYFWHYLANVGLTFISNIFTNLNLTDMETCYKVFRRELIQSITLEENSFGIEPEITAKIAHLRPRIYEVGIAYYGRTYDEGKKIGMSDAFVAVWAIIKYNVLARLGKYSTNKT
ncbi:MAG: glycosyltransferase family 2 protein [Microgenomates group bacterium]